MPVTPYYIDLEDYSFSPDYANTRDNTFSITGKMTRDLLRVLIQHKQLLDSLAITNNETWPPDIKKFAETLKDRYEDALESYQENFDVDDVEEWEV